MNRHESQEISTMLQNALFMFSQKKFNDMDIDCVRQEVFDYLAEQREKLSEKYYGSKYKGYDKDNIGV